MAATRTGPRVIARAQRRAEAVRLRASGMTLGQVADRLGVSEATARRDVTRALDRLAAHSAHHADRLRELDGVRIEALIAAWTERAASDPAAAAVVLRALDQFARLYGLNAPPSGASAAPVSAVNIRLLPAAGTAPEVIGMRPAGDSPMN